MIILLIVIILISLLIIAISLYFSNITINPKTWDYNETFKTEVNSSYFDESWYNSLKKEEIYINSLYGYKLHGIYFPNNNSKKTIIFCHGFTYTLFGSVKYMNIFLKRGFNVLIYDHRFHGKSEGKYTTYGFYERYDLKAFTDYILERNGNNSIVGIHGESMGAATALLNSAIDSRVNFYIADCPYKDLKTLLKYHLKYDYDLPYFPIVNMASLICFLRAGFFYKNVCPEKEIAHVLTPIFFIHGDDDKFIPCSMSMDMYNSKKGIKKLYLAKGADHAKSYFVDKEEYEKQIDNFLKEIKII